MEFRILGALEVANNAGNVPIAGGKQRALLALLIVHAGELLPAERIVDELWGDDAPAEAMNSLQSLISKLRRAFGAVRSPISRRRSACGEARRWRTSPTRGSPATRSHGWRSCGSVPSKNGSMPFSPLAATPN